MGQTFVQKILGNAVGKAVVPGEIVIVEPDIVLTHDCSYAVIEKFISLVNERGVKYPDSIALVLECVLSDSPGMSAVVHSKIRRFVQEHDISNFFDVGSGASHQVLIEEHLAKPGYILVGHGSGICSYGALNTLTSNISIDEMAEVWKTGRTSIKVPETIEIKLDGYFGRRVSAMDLALVIIGKLGTEGAKGKALEFHGTAVGGLLIHERVVIANMGSETAAEIAVFPADRIAQNFLCSEGVCEKAEWSDIDAEFADSFIFDLDTVVPMVAKPHSADNVCPVLELPQTKVDLVCLGTSTTGTAEDLKSALQIMGGRPVSPSVRMLVGTASREEFLKALKLGLIEEFVKAGAIVIPPGCGTYFGSYQGILAPGEVCFSTANSNIKGIMGEDAFVYLGSPETAAATAVRGIITDPRVL